MLAEPDQTCYKCPFLYAPKKLNYSLCVCLSVKENQRSRKMVPLVKCFPCEHEDPSLDPEHPHKIHVSGPSSQEDPWGLLDSQASQS